MTEQDLGLGRMTDKPLEWTEPGLRRDLEALARQLDEAPVPVPIIVPVAYKDSWVALYGDDKLPPGYAWSERMPVSDRDKCRPR